MNTRIVLKLLFVVHLLILNSFSFAEDKLVIWTSNEHVRDAIKQSVAPFEKEYGAKIEIMVLSKDLTTQFKTAAIANKGPDIFAWGHDVIGELAESGLIESINLSPKLKKSFLKVALNAFTYKGKVYGYPYDLEAVALIYNKKLVPTVPSSMEELVKMAQKMTNKKKGTYGFLYDFASFFFSFPMLSAGGGYVFKDNNGKLDINDIGLANKGAIEGAKFIGSLEKSGLIPSSTDRSIAFNLMKKGKLAMTIDGPWAIADLRKSKIDYGIAPIPTLNGNRPKPFVGSHGFIIRKSSKNKELAKVFIETYLVSKEGILRLYSDDPRGPSRTDVIEELSKGNKNPDLKNFMDSASIGIPMPNVPEMGSVWGAAGSALASIITRQATPENALKQAKKQVLASLKK